MEKKLNRNTRSFSFKIVDFFFEKLKSLINFSVFKRLFEGKCSVRVNWIDLNKFIIVTFNFNQDNILYFSSTISDLTRTFSVSAASFRRRLLLFRRRYFSTQRKLLTTERRLFVALRQLWFGGQFTDVKVSFFWPDVDFCPTIIA